MMLQDTAGNVVWANDNKTLFYVTKDKLDRPFKVPRHSRAISLPYKPLLASSQACT